MFGITEKRYNENIYRILMGILEYVYPDLPPASTAELLTNINEIWYTGSQNNIVSSFK